MTETDSDQQLGAGSDHVVVSSAIETKTTSRSGPEPRQRRVGPVKAANFFLVGKSRAAVTTRYGKGGY